jgi:hypothetical protein
MCLWKDYRYQQWIAVPTQKVLVLFLLSTSIE